MRARFSVSRRICASSRDFFASFWKLQIVGWLSFYVLVFVARLPFPTTGRELNGIALTVACMFLGSITLHPICRAILPRTARWVTFELGVFVGSLVIGGFWRLVMQVVVAGTRGLELRSWTIGTVQYTIVLFLWGSLYFSIKQWQRLMEAETEARDARLAALRYQLNPHFLFNSLNAVSTLVVESNAPAATRMLSQIGDYLRATLDTPIQSEIPLSDEIALTDRYLAIEQARLEGRLTVRLQIAPDAWDAAVPSLLLQPLVENAVRHGIAARVDGGTLGIRCDVYDEQLCVTVRNSGPLYSPNGRNGIGLVNTAERLRVLYGEDHDFALRWPASGGCEATIRIPFRRLACAS
jgi:two-component system, LytTR family, sensor kinase